jgi:acetate kinase
MVFTGGLGENDVMVREAIIDRVSEAMGINLNRELNLKTRGKEVCLSDGLSKTAVWIVPTNEELVIAQDTQRILGL